MRRPDRNSVFKTVFIYIDRITNRLEFVNWSDVLLNTTISVPTTSTSRVFQFILEPQEQFPLP
jgi:hypothetical protein